MKIRIKIKNCSEEQLSITKEPEAVEAFIDANHSVEIETNDQEDNITINVGKNKDGTIYIQVWDALKTRYMVYYEGENLFKDF